MADTGQSKANILLVEDDDSQRSLIAGILEHTGYQVTAVDGVEAAILALKKAGFDLVFSDWKLGSLSGLDLLSYIKRNQIQVGFAMATAYGTIAHAVEAIAAGADDYLAKPFEKQALLLCIEKVLKANALRCSNRDLRAALSEQASLVDLVGNAPCMQQVYQRIERVSATSATILITGESGTGKELAARALHQLSGRQGQAFVAVNCGAIPESLAEAELFGSVKGAFTGANTDKIGQLQAANKGTLFLDEVGELSLSVQAKLLRFLQEGQVTPVGNHETLSLDVRVIAATHRDLQQMVAREKFREDLYYRLNIVPIHMPPLRQRKQDIAKLAHFFINKFSQQYGVPAVKLDPGLLEPLLDYSWPGNVRELSNRIERFVLLGDKQELENGLVITAESKDGGFVLPEQGINWELFEKDCLQQALQRCNGNRTLAAKLMGLNYKAFLYRLDKHGLA